MKRLDFDIASAIIPLRSSGNNCLAMTHVMWVVENEILAVARSSSYQKYQKMSIVIEKFVRNRQKG